ncbi:hypothetical protein BDP81DRAFT_396759 [Colletotrichum phormii]|uniref:Uncharacterized protein n=1 Tax=Colletotrichum phormii TaxID=359342 RepID=A0AAI9ZNC1_9PEZI|nr:uncharacterized protein BDP81DRAFT_396759 [Colletotrichum phormii]KAK1634053.1 hypothetical protein BDP81DRAFT_396759 [Colletotrichum phormii]
MAGLAAKDSKAIGDISKKGIPPPQSIFLSIAAVIAFEMHLYLDKECGNKREWSTDQLAHVCNVSVSTAELR